MKCCACSYEAAPTSKFCLKCETVLNNDTQVPSKDIPARFLPVMAEYEEFTITKLSPSQKLEFIKDVSVGKLSLNDKQRRLNALKRVLVPKGDGTFDLNVHEWSQAMYNLRDPQVTSTARVWTTPGGEKYHMSRDCRALLAGQSFASSKGKDTYKPEFLTLRDASWRLGKTPCDICKPKKWKK